MKKYIPLFEDYEYWKSIHDGDKPNYRDTVGSSKYPFQGGKEPYTEFVGDLDTMKKNTQFRFNELLSGMNSMDELINSEIFKILFDCDKAQMDEDGMLRIYTKS